MHEYPTPTLKAPTIAQVKKFEAHSSQDLHRKGAVGMSTIHLYSGGIIGRPSKVVNKAYKIYTKGTLPAIRKCPTIVAHTACTNNSNISHIYYKNTQGYITQLYIMSHINRTRENMQIQDHQIQVKEGKTNTQMTSQ